MTGAPGGRVPATGDRVAAVTDNRDAFQVVGILHIRHIPGADYIEVIVLSDRRAWSVVPESIEVLEPAAVALADLEEGDPLVGQAGWRRITNLAEARESGLLQPPVRRVGGTWTDMFDELARWAQPLLDAGWRLTSTDRDESWEFGDSVFYDLERDGTAVELEYYEHGQLVAYSLGDDEQDEEPADPLFSIPKSTAEAVLHEFRAQGWL